MNDYKTGRAAACLQLFQNFSPDVSKSHNPERILKIARLAAQGLFAHEISEHVGKSPKAVQKIFRFYNFPVLHNFFRPQLSDHPNWKGGEKLAKGYAYVITPNHPNSLKHGNYVAKHRLVMEQKIGRFLTKKEVVDHIDGNIANNDPSNLRLFSSNAEHLRVTLRGRCPNWSEAGKKSLARARNSKRRTWKGRIILPIPDA